jgi:hypothetical protein
MQAHGQTPISTIWQITKRAALATAALQLTSCATAIRGTSDEMAVTTEPPGAVVTTSLELPKSKRARRKNPDLAPEYYGCPETPCEFSMPRRAMFIMTFEKEGYEPVSIGVEGTFGKRALAANLGGGAATAAVMGAGAAATVSGLSSIGGAAGAGGAAAGVATAGIFLVPVGVDLMTGSMLNHNPNPVTIVLPPKGTVFEPDPNLQRISEEIEKRDQQRARRLAKKKAIQEMARNQ